MNRRHDARVVTNGQPSRPGGMGPGGRGGFGPGPALGRPVEKPKNFQRTFFRLIGYFRPYRTRLLVVLLAAVLATVFSIVSPKILGQATTDIFNGMIMKMKGVPGGGVPFHAILHILLTLAVLYVFSTLFNYVQQYVMAGVAQSVVYDLRKRVNEKLSRLPLHFYDSRPQDCPGVWT